MMKYKQYISLACRIFLVGMMFQACIGKVWDPTAFAASMAVYNIMPMIVINGGSALLAWFEMVMAVFLLLGLWTRTTAFWVALMMACFTGLMIYVGITGLVIHDCGCFPGVVSEAGYMDALRDIGFLIPAVILTVWPDTPYSLDRWICRRWPPKEPVLGATCQ